VTNTPAGNGLIGPFQHIQVTHLMPAALVQRMQQVEINVIGLQLGKLLVQKPVEILGTFYFPARQLGSQAHSLAVTAGLEDASHKQLALVAMIGIGGVNIIHPLVDGMVHHAGCLRFINICGSAVGGQAHTTKAQC